ncbi:putative disease resistance RPP13-like protein 1 [Acorus gramineus]|uniref:Disease resistance RPP13-like protein 1 n=1 Tax=Acorus gramineus TaxID=55184 RepID=A0AAV9A5C5_ACOGR|nr:putative disease resistance RPP13-like protein 1 [Acorus gramineus]
MKIVKECKGLPLAIKAIGGVLNKKERKKDAWEIVMKSFYKLSSSEVLPALRLSYMDLPSYLKPFFLYCSLFPEDHRISRADITRMWLAEGFVKAEGIDVAEAYHEELIARNLLQVVDVNRYYEEQDFLMDLRCKMHDLVRDMAISMTQGEHIFGRPQQHTEGASLKPRRLSIISGDEDEDALELKEIPLRSLLVFNGPWTRREIQGDLFDKLKYLRVVNLRRTFIERLPDSIGKLIQLRYLDLSGTEIAELPDSLCNLQNLQTLFLRGCRNLTKLPKDLPHLKELQHICVSQSEYTGEADVMMPAGTRELVKLQTLDSFTIYDIGHNNGGEGPHNDDEVGCNIHELGSLSHLKYLRIQRLERVQSGAEAKKAMIQNKIHLRSLGLWWSKRDLEYSSRIDIPPEEVKMKQMEEVFEEFRPPSSLQVLDVYGFGGRELPSWMMPTSNFLDNLLYLELCKVKFITRLPSLGHLPQLKKLRVVDNQGIVSIGPEFLFGERERRGRGIFPKLEFLLFEWMKVWEEWSDGMERKEGKSRVTKIGDAGGGGKSLDILPRLRKLRLNSSFRLRTLPGCLVHVRELTLLNCYTLEYLWNLLALQSLNVVNCGALKDMTNLGASSLTQISFRFYYDVSVENNMEALRSVKITDETLLIIHGPPGFASKCSVEDGPYTPIIHRFPRVQVFEDIKHIFSYTQSTSETRIQPT